VLSEVSRQGRQGRQGDGGFGLRLGGVPEAEPRRQEGHEARGWGCFATSSPYASLVLPSGHEPLGRSRSLPLLRGLSVFVSPLCLASLAALAAQPPTARAPTITRPRRSRPPPTDLLDRRAAWQARRQRVEEHPPYPRVTIRPSRIATMPRSSRRRISRPKPCLSAIAAAGSWIAANGSSPASARACIRAAISGSVCGANGSLSITTRLSASPGRRRPPERARPEEDRVRRRPEPIDQRRAWRLALDQPRERQAGEARGRLAQRAVTGEQQKRAAGRDREQLGHSFGRRRREAVVDRRQIARDVEHRLARVVERRADEQLVGLVESERARVYAKSPRRSVSRT